MATVAFVLKKNIFNFETAVLLSVLREKGVQACLLFGEQEEDLLERLEALQPTMVGFVSEIAYVLDLVQGEFTDNVNILRKVKRVLPQAATFVGGTHGTILPDLQNTHESVDLLFFGDMEESLAECALRLDRGETVEGIPGVACRREGEIFRSAPPRKTRLDELPDPDIAAFYQTPGSFRKGFRLPFARGCPNSCKLCYNHRIAEITNLRASECPRYYPVDYLISSINKIVEQEPFEVQTIYLNYGTFTHSKEYVQEFTGKYKSRVGIPYVIATRLDRIDDDIAGWLKESGCSKVSVSIETGNERLRNDVLGKNLSDEDIFRGMSILKKHGLRVGVSLLFGFPDETVDDAFETLEMARQIKSDFLGPSVYVPIPGVSLTQYAVERGYLPADYGLRNFRQTILGPKEYRKIKNISQLCFVYQAAPVRWLFKLLIALPENRFYLWSFHIVRIMAVLRYDMKESSIFQKIKYVLDAHVSIFLRGVRPNLIMFKQNIQPRTLKQEHRGAL